MSQAAVHGGHRSLSVRPIGPMVSQGKSPAAERVTKNLLERLALYRQSARRKAHDDSLRR
jgi:hypothetical protein